MIKWAVYLIYWARKSVFSVCKRRKVHRASTEPQLNEAYSGGREKTNIQHFFSSLPGWTCSVNVFIICALEVRTYNLLGWGTTSTPPKG